MVTQGSSTSETGQARSWKKAGLVEECWTSTEVKPCALEMHARINTIQGRMHGILTCSLCSPTGHDFCQWIALSVENCKKTCCETVR